MLELFKKLSPIELDDELASYYISIGTGMVRKYVNNDNIDIEYEFQYQIIQTAIWLVQMNEQSKATTENGGIKSLSSDGRSIVWFGLNDFANMELPSNIKAQLPHYAKAW
jgi:hypothetical protein